MKIKVGQNEFEITQLFDTAQRRAGDDELDQKQVVVYLKEAQAATSVQTLLDQDYDGEITLIRDDSSQETFTGLENYVVSRNVEEGSEQTSIRFY